MLHPHSAYGNAVVRDVGSKPSCQLTTANVRTRCCRQLVPDKRRKLHPAKDERRGLIVGFISDQPFESHLLGITKRSLNKEKILRSVSCNSSLASNFERDTERCDNQPWQPRGMFPSNHPVPVAVPALPPRPSRRLPDLGRAQGTKPSSRALPGTVPFLPPVETRMPLNWGWGLAPIQSVPSQRAQPQGHSSALRNCSKSHSPTTSIASSQNSSTMSVVKSPVSPARSTRSIPRRSPLSTMRRVSNPDVPIYEEFIGKRSQPRLKKCWDSTKTLDNGDGRKELGNAQERTFPQNKIVASPALKKSLVAAATPGQTQYPLQNAPRTPCTLSSIEIPNLAASLTNPCDTVQQETAVSSKSLSIRTVSTTAAKPRLPPAAYMREGLGKLSSF
ncbi:MAG: hypothetical protein M1835_008125 [Candelina submexicana]|nr:MAG: hypothetical protein M1835_008125 [Candelina submexicana]